MRARVAALLSIAPVAIACGAADSRPPPEALDLSEEQELYSGGDERDVVAAGACEAGESRECRIYLPAYNGVQPCFVGDQYCIDGTWSHCIDSDLVDANDEDALLAMEEVLDQADAAAE